MNITELVSKCARGMNEQLLKTPGIDVLSSKKRLRKTLWGRGGIHPPLYVRGLKFIKVNNNDNANHDDDDDDGGEERSHQNPQVGGDAAGTVNQGLNV